MFLCQINLPWKEREEKTRMKCPLRQQFKIIYLTSLRLRCSMRTKNTFNKIENEKKKKKQPQSFNGTRSPTKQSRVSVGALVHFLI